MRLTVSDGTLSAAASLTVVTANRPPIAMIAPLAAAHVALPLTLDGSPSSDPDGDALSFAWSVVTAPLGSVARPQQPSADIAVFTADRAGAYQLRLIVGDATATATATVDLSTLNTRPVADAGPTQTAAVGTLVTLDGSRSTDVDGDPLTHQWQLVARPGGSQAVLSDPAAVTPTFTVDAPGSYLWSLVVSDPSGASSLPSTTTISTINSPPVANAGPDQTAERATLVHVSGAASTDVDGDVLAYLWSFMARPAGSQATLATPTTVTASFVPDVRGTYVVRLTVADASGAIASDTMVVAAANSAPVAHAGPDQSMPVGARVQLDGSASTDADGDAVGYLWTFTSRPPSSAAVLSDGMTASPSFTVDIAGLYTLQLVVSDGEGGSSIDTVVLTTTNSRPVADGGLDQATAPGQIVTLDGRRSLDADGDPLTFAWALTTVPSGSQAVLSDPTAIQPTFTADRAGTFVAQLTVHDAGLASMPDTVTITSDNATPVADAGPDLLRTPLGARVDLDGRGSSDADGQPLTYRWAILSRPAGSAVTLTNASGATPSFVPDVGGEFILQLIVGDGFVESEPDTAFVRVNRRPVANAGVDRSATTGASVVLDGSGSSDPDLDGLSFTWALTTPAGSGTGLSNPNGATVSFAPDVAGTYVARLIVHDGLNDSTPDDVVVTVAATTVLTIGPTSASAVTLSTVSLTVATSTPAGAGGVAIAMASSDAGVATVPSTVTIPAGATTASIAVAAGTEAGTATITASAAGAAPASATVTVARRTMAVGLAGGTITVGGSVTGTITLAQPAPAGGVGVTLAVTPAAVATVSPMQVTIAPGGTGATFSVTGTGLGTMTISATAAGFEAAATAMSSTMSMTFGATPLTIERSDAPLALLTLSAPAPAGGVVVTLSSDDPSRATIQPSVTVRAGASVVNVVVRGIAEGATLVRAIAAGVTAAVLPVTVTSPSSAFIESAPANGEAGVAVTRETVLRFSPAARGAAAADAGDALRDLRRPRSSDAHPYLARQPGDHAVPPADAAGQRPRPRALPDRRDRRRDRRPARRRLRRPARRPADRRLRHADADVAAGHGGHRPGLRLGAGRWRRQLRRSPACRQRRRPRDDASHHHRCDGELPPRAGAGRRASSSTSTGGRHQRRPRSAATTRPSARSGRPPPPDSQPHPSVFLPLIAPGTLQPVQPDRRYRHHFPGRDRRARIPELAGVRITVPADALYSDGGARGGMVGIAPVAPDRIPSPLPPGLDLPARDHGADRRRQQFRSPGPGLLPESADPAHRPATRAGLVQRSLELQPRHGRMGARRADARHG